MNIRAKIERLPDNRWGVFVLLRGGWRQIAACVKHSDAIILRDQKRAEAGRNAHKRRHAHKRLKARGSRPRAVC